MPVVGQDGGSVAVSMTASSAAALVVSFSQVVAVATQHTQRDPPESMARIPTDLCRIPAGEVRREGRRFVQRAVGWGECPPFLGLGVVAAGVTEAGPGFTVATTPGIAGVMVCLAGEGRLALDGRWERWRPGQAALLPRGARHVYAHGRGRWRLAWVCWRDDLGGGRAPSLRAWDAAGLEPAIEGCWRERNAADTAAMHHWATLVALIARRADLPAEDPRLVAVARAVDADLAQAWTLADLARIAGCGIETLRLLVRRSAGGSPMAWLTARRMRLAATLLAGADDPVAAIGERVGYANPFAFTAAFKRAMGVPPTRYRGERRGGVLIPGDPQGRPPSRGGRGSPHRQAVKRP